MVKSVLRVSAVVMDQFSEHHQDLIEGSYDCVDRIVLNAYFLRGQDPGGVRLWWRALYGLTKIWTPAI